MLDRLSLLVPGWTERSAADVGVALVELLAFAADTLSYRQDVIANEAYLNTARQRISVRRHARLVDYYLHEGCNARAFVHFDVTTGASDQVLPHRTRLLTSAPRVPTVMEPGSRRGTARARSGCSDLRDRARGHAARGPQPTSPSIRGATRGAACRGARPRRRSRATWEGCRPGDFLVFQEMVSPTTFQPEDADRAHRHVVRLTRVTSWTSTRPAVCSRRPPVDAPAPITRIEWDASDALPFALCVSVTTRPA